jgi:cytochrome P450
MDDRLTNPIEEADAIFVDPQKYADPDAWHATARWLRQHDPLHRVEADGFPPFYAVTRLADVMEVERQPDKFLNTMAVFLQRRGELDRQMAEGIALKTLVNMDGAEHLAHRGLVNEWFKPSNLRRHLEVFVTELARRYVDRMVELGGECDFAADIAKFYPLHVIMSILGVPEADEPLMLKLTQNLLGAGDPDLRADEDGAESVRKALGGFAAYFRELAAARRAEPTGDLATVIANGRIDGAPLGDVQTFSYYVIMATAGHDTTSNSLAGGLHALVSHPEQLRLLQEEPRLIDNAVDEMIRWVSPVRGFLRHAQVDYRLGGTRIRAGDRLLMSYPSANRDEAVFEDPFRFDVRRKNANEHLAFGAGVHFCLGAHLARMELRAFFRELLSRLDSLSLSAPSEDIAALIVGGPKRVPIKYRLRPA